MLIMDCYSRLCSPKEMGLIYKVMFIGNKEAGEVYPFISQESYNEGNI